MSEGSDTTLILMASLFSVDTLVEYEAQFVSDFDTKGSCFGEWSFYYCIGVYRLYLVKNLTPMQASPVRKRVRPMKVTAQYYYYDEGMFIIHETSAIYNLDLNEKMTKAVSILEMLQHLAFRIWMAVRA
jgi:hypothetical protein